jgi:hypothetical protein
MNIGGHSVLAELIQESIDYRIRELDYVISDISADLVNDYIIGIVKQMLVVPVSGRFLNRNSQWLGNPYHYLMFTLLTGD